MQGWRKGGSESLDVHSFFRLGVGIFLTYSDEWVVCSQRVLEVAEGRPGLVHAVPGHVDDAVKEEENPILAQEEGGRKDG